MHLRRLAAAALLTTAVSTTPLNASPSGYHIANSIPGPDGGWDYASYDRDTGKLFVARTDGVTVVDTRTGVVMPKLASATHAHAVLPIPNSNEILMTDGTSGTAQLIDKTSGAVRAKISVGEKPDAAVFDPVMRQAIVINAKSGTVSFIDPLKAVVMKTVTLIPGLEFAAIDSNRRLFVANEDENILHVVDLATGTVNQPVALPGCESPSGLAYISRARSLVAACANGKAAIINADTLSLTQLVDIGLGPDAVIPDQTLGRAYIPCGASGQLDVLAFDAQRARLLESIKTEAGARTGAINPSNGRIYLPTARFGPKPQEGRAPIIPDSFHVIVLKTG